MNVLCWALIVGGLAALAVALGLETAAIGGGMSPLLLAAVGLILCAAGYGVHKLSRR